MHDLSLLNRIISIHEKKKESIQNGEHVYLLELLQFPMIKNKSLNTYSVILKTLPEFTVEMINNVQNQIRYMYTEYESRNFIFYE